MHIVNVDCRIPGSYSDEEVCKDALEDYLTTHNNCSLTCKDFEKIYDCINDVYDELGDNLSDEELYMNALKKYYSL